MTVLRNWPGSKTPKSLGVESKARARTNPDKERIALLEAENQELRQEREQRDHADRDWLLNARVEEIVEAMPPERLRELVDKAKLARERGRCSLGARRRE